MSREIMFKAYDYDTKRVYHDINVMKTTWGKTLIFLDDGESTWGERLHNAIVLLYTGLKDKNGVKVYEGDIVTYPYGVPPERKNYEVKFGYHQTSADFYASEAYGFYLSALFNEERELAFNEEYVTKAIEVIGTVYEDKGLLNEE